MVLCVVGDGGGRRLRLPVGSLWCGGGFEANTGKTSTSQDKEYPAAQEPELLGRVGK